MVNLVWVTPDAEKLIAEIARVSNPKNQKNPKYSGLIRYLIEHKHWSPFEMVSMCLEIDTSRRIAPQILRHRSFSFQEFSTRYAAVEGFVEVNPRSQDLTNRQSSHDDLPDNIKKEFQNQKNFIEYHAMKAYQWALDNGVSKESAAFLLPMTAKTKIYMTGTIRSWIHYIELRGSDGTQLEHREIALAAKTILLKELPNIGIALGWIEQSDSTSKD